MGNDYRARVTLLVTACALGLSSAAHAQGGDAAAAEALFREGRKLLEAGDVAAACGKLSESNRLDPSSGTLINLADCHVKEGKIASAWAEFLSAARLARTQGNPARADEATKRAGEMEKQLSYFQVTIADKVPGMEVKRDDTLLQEGSLSSKIPIDPGTHVISATAPGYTPWSKTIVIKPNGDLQAVTIPALQKDASAKVAPPPTATGSAAGSPVPPMEKKSPTLGYVAIGVGGAALLVGGFFGLKALSTYKDAENKCGGQHTGCPQDALDQRTSAGTQAIISDVGVGLGVVGLALGTYLVVSSSGGKEQQAVRIAPAVSPSFAGAAIGGAF